MGLVAALVLTTVGATYAVRHRGSASAGPTPPDYREAIVAAQRPLILNPLLARADPASRDVTTLLNPGLLRLNTRVAPAPELATSWGVSGDGLSYRFQMVPGRRWSDGTPITPADVAATVSLVQRPGFPDAALASIWKGVTASSQGAAAITMTLPTPRAAFAVEVADLPILPATIARRSLADLVATEHNAVVASGPMRVSSASDLTVELAANPTALPAPRLRTIELRLEPDFIGAARALATGQVDAVLASNPAERNALADMPAVTVHDMVSLSFVDLLLNTRRPGLNDPVVRRALATGIDRAALIKDALHAGGRTQVDAIPAGILWLGAGSSEQPDPALAARALDAAGYVPEPRTGVRVKGSVRLDYTLDVPDAGPLPAVAHELALQLAAVGIGATVVRVPSDRFTESVVFSPTYDMAVAEWDSGADPDVSAYWRSNAKPPAGFNASGLPADPFLDRALDSLATELDPQLRAEAAQRVDQRLAISVPAVFLYAPLTSFAVSRAIAHVTLPEAGDPAARYAGITDWSRSP